jgi:hypothetical protein
LSSQKYDKTLGFCKFVDWQLTSVPMASNLPEDIEERRLRQVHQYLSLRDERNLRRFGVGSLEKGEKRLEVNKIESPDTALTAFTQLVAWRLDAQRAIVSLVDRNDQVWEP